MFQSLLLLAVALPWAVSGAPAPDTAEVEDKCSLDRVDLCMQSLVVYSINDSLPLDGREIEEACEREDRDLACLQKFLNNDCVHGFARALLRSAHEGIRNEREAKCDTGSGRRREYMDFIPCVNKAGPKLRNCMRRMVQQAEAVHRHTPKRQRIPYGCCTFETYVNCIHEITGEVCSPEHADYVRSVVKNAAGDVMTTACETYESAPICKELEKLPLEEPKAVAFTSPLINVLEYVG